MVRLSYRSDETALPRLVEGLGYPLEAEQTLRMALTAAAYLFVLKVLTIRPAHVR